MINKRSNWSAVNAYNWAIESEYKNKQDSLPEGNTISRFMLMELEAGSIYPTKSGNGTQKEHMEIAKACAEV